VLEAVDGKEISGIKVDSSKSSIASANQVNDHEERVLLSIKLEAETPRLIRILFDSRVLRMLLFVRSSDVLTPL